MPAMYLNIPADFQAIFAQAMAAEITPNGRLVSESKHELTDKTDEPYDVIPPLSSFIFDENPNLTFVCRAIVLCFTRWQEIDPVPNLKYLPFMEYISSTPNIFEAAKAGVSVMAGSINLREIKGAPAELVDSILLSLAFETCVKLRKFVKAIGVRCYFYATTPNVRIAQRTLQVDTAVEITIAE